MRKRIPEPEQKCVVHGCDETIEARGLCQVHYSKAYYQVEVKHSTTWRKLERANPPLALPKAKSKKSSDPYLAAIAATK